MSDEADIEKLGKDKSTDEMFCIDSNNQGYKSEKELKENNSEETVRNQNYTNNSCVTDKPGKPFEISPDSSVNTYPCDSSTREETETESRNNGNNLNETNMSQGNLLDNLNETNMSQGNLLDNLNETNMSQGNLLDNLRKHIENHGNGTDDALSRSTCNVSGNNVVNITLPLDLQSNANSFEANKDSGSNEYMRSVVKLETADIDFPPSNFTIKQETGPDVDEEQQITVKTEHVQSTEEFFPRHQQRIHERKKFKARTRRLFNEHSLQIMEQFYLKNNHPSLEDLRGLADEIDETLYRLKNWFNNRNNNRYRAQRLVITKDPRQVQASLKLRRTRFSTEQHSCLTKAFRKQSYPCYSDYRALAEETGLSYMQVYNWFRYTRKNKKEDSKHATVSGPIDVTRLFSKREHTKHTTLSAPVAMAKQKFRKEIRRRRQNYSVEQQQMLHNAFTKKRFPDYNEYKMLSQQVGISVQRIRSWFSYRRRKPVTTHDTYHKNTNTRLFTREEKAILNDVFLNTPNPSLEEVKNLADRLNTSSERINKWFSQKNSRISYRSKPVTTYHKNTHTKLFTREERTILNDVFLKTPYPSLENVEILANELNTSSERISKWFSQKNSRISHNNCVDNELLWDEQCNRNEINVRSTDFSVESEAVLNNIYKLNPHPSCVKINSIAEVLGESSDKISAWFRLRNPEKKIKKINVSHRKCLNISIDQRKALNEFYAKENYPSKTRVLDIAEQLSLKSSEVKAYIWRQRSRSRIKANKIKKERIYAHSKLSVKKLDSFQKKQLDEFMECNPNPSVSDIDDLSEQMNISKMSLTQYLRHAKNGCLKRKVKKIGFYKKFKKLEHADKLLLEEFFEKNPYPSPLEKANLAEKFSVSIQTIIFWFLNAQKRIRKKKPDRILGNNNKAYLNDQMKQFLRQYHEKNPEPSIEEKHKIAAALKVPRRCVQMWFCNKRLHSQNGDVSSNKAMLEKYFSKNPFPNQEERIQLAESLGITVRSVIAWFYHAQKKKGIHHKQDNCQKVPHCSSSKTSYTSCKINDGLHQYQKDKVTIGNAKCQIVLSKCNKISKNNLKKLRILYDMYENPSEKELNMFAVNLGLTSNTVKQWFKDKSSSSNPNVLGKIKLRTDIKEEVIAISDDDDESADDGGLQPEFSDDGGNIVGVHQTQFKSTINSWLDNISTDPDNDLEDNQSTERQCTASTLRPRTSEPSGVFEDFELSADKQLKLWDLFKLNANPSLHELEISSKLLDTNLLTVVKWYEKARQISSQQTSPNPTISPLTTSTQHIPPGFQLPTNKRMNSDFSQHNTSLGSNSNERTSARTPVMNNPVAMPGSGASLSFHRDMNPQNMPQMNIHHSNIHMKHENMSSAKQHITSNKSNRTSHQANLGSRQPNLNTNHQVRNVYKPGSHQPNVHIQHEPNLNMHQTNMNMHQLNMNMHQQNALMHNIGSNMNYPSNTSNRLENSMPYPMFSSNNRNILSGNIGSTVSSRYPNEDQDCIVID